MKRRYHVIRQEQVMDIRHRPPIDQIAQSLFQGASMQGWYEPGDPCPMTFPVSESYQRWQNKLALLIEARVLTKGKNYLKDGLSLPVNWAIGVVPKPDRMLPSCIEFVVVTPGTAASGKIVRRSGHVQPLRTQRLETLHRLNLCLKHYFT